ncbi:hypothetical protein [Mucilaginibacter sp.]|uniref:hypothetical protein n=1 Tax=Mucilaginibacter sp. TaxID=1882438 RepID=UPI003D10A764
MNRFLILSLLFVFGLYLPGLVYAQEQKFIPLSKHPKNDTITVITPDTVKQLDMYDVIAKLFHKKNEQGGDSVGVKPVFSIVPALGYTLQSKLALTLAGNVAFRLTPGSKISTITINTAYTQTKQIIIPIQSSIWTNDNEYNFVGDIRYYRYPQSSYGLGSNSNIANEQPMRYSFFRFNETVLKRLLPNLYAGAGYILDDHWHITHKKVIDGAPSDYEAYGATRSSRSSGITLNMLFDSRDNSINAEKGFYGAVQYRDNEKVLGSNGRWQSLVIDVRKYIRFPEGTDNVLALWSYNWLVLGGRPPYLDLPANTWDPYSGTGRGYIQGRFRGAQMVYAESEYRFNITRNRLLGGVVFVNAESFSAAPGTALQSVQPAFGPGLRLKLNKVSKTSIAVDYGIGRQGSRGVFINVGEIF